MRDPNIFGIRTKFNRVIERSRERHMSLNQYAFPLPLRRLETAAHLHEVVHHPAGILFRNNDTDMQNGLQQLRAGIGQPIHHSHRCGDGKIQRMGMPNMMLAIGSERSSSR